ncbi:hypothetical protein [Hansschlegelia zhihuaiae]|uniref:Uncharacterized protein n=1 Tax=Hansschlegelia zhihuaiae TaxID=405005 RepID=A0A4Q0MNI9_9HYPH|nr:hypothetical protein [Hansschlegelia zhihuaiae]RXF74649.1 hypothetical protein EK403_04450 [Hansschlegelia zhihuaiae]
MASGPNGARGDSERSSREEVAAYVAAISRDLRDISRRNGLVTLGYLLDMAQLEADLAARGRDVEGRRRSEPGVDLA